MNLKQKTNIKCIAKSKRGEGEMEHQKYLKRRQKMGCKRKHKEKKKKTRNQTYIQPYKPLHQM